jgi:membrane-associated protease RseP (regulator of RpoE activity)
MEVGAAGPLAGVAVAIPILLFGLTLSTVEPIPSGSLAGGYIMGESLLCMLLERIAVGEIPAGSDVIFHPMALAGWFGLLVTMINLIPISQLDGGHIFYALFGKAHLAASRLFFAGLFALGFGIIGNDVFAAIGLGLEGDAFGMYIIPGSNWLVFGVLLFLLTRRRGLGHPPTDDNAISKGHFAVGIVCLLLFVLTFTPVPIRPVL